MIHLGWDHGTISGSVRGDHIGRRLWMNLHSRGRLRGLAVERGAGRGGQLPAAEAVEAGGRPPLRAGHLHGVQVLDVKAEDPHVALHTLRHRVRGFTVRRRGRPGQTKQENLTSD